MARYNIKDIERLNICPILYKKKWDYIDPIEHLDKTFLYGVKEMIRWYYRRGKQIFPETLVSSVSQFAFNRRVPVQEKIDLESAFRQYLISSFYQQMDPPFYKKEIDISIGNNLTIFYKAPCIVKKDKTVYFLSFEYGKESKETFLNRYEIILETMWSFYVLDQVPVFINIYYENGQIKEDKFKVKLDYITQAKERMFQIGKSINNFAPPPPVICNNCDRREECPTKKMTSLLKK